MHLVVVVVGALIIAAGLVVLLRPLVFFAALDRVRTPAGLRSIAALRVVLGLVFLAVATDCRWPTFVQVLGWITIASGVATALIGAERAGRLIDWWQARPPAVIRAWGLVALALGGAITIAGT